MKNCSEINDMLSFYLMNELHENDRKQVVKHLEDCEECKAELEQMRHVIEAVEELEEVELPENFMQSLHEKLVEESKHFEPVKTQKKSNFRWISAMAAGFGLVIAIAGVGYFSKYSNPSMTAYVNDAKLETVGKAEMDKQEGQKELASNFDVVKQKTPEIAAFNEAQKAEGAPKTQQSLKAAQSVQKPLNTTTAQANTTQPQQENTVSGSSNADTQVAMTAPRVTTDTARTFAAQQPTTLSLLVDNTSATISQVKSIVQNNGGSISETSTARTFAFEDSQSVGSSKSFTISVPASSYNNVILSLKKVGTVEGSTVQSKTSAAKSVSTQDVTIRLTIQQK